MKIRTSSTIGYLIYGLLDPRRHRLDELRYIGKSTWGISRATGTHNGLCGTWFTHLNRINLKPRVVVLFESKSNDEQELFDVEMMLIAAYRAVGADLKNMSSGGEGAVGVKRSEEHCRKLAAANRGKKASDETRKKLSEAAKQRDPAVKKKAIESLRRSFIANGYPNEGRKFSAEARKNMSKAHIGKKGCPVSQKERMNRSERTKKQWQAAKAANKRTLGNTDPVFGSHADGGMAKALES